MSDHLIAMLLKQQVSTSPENAPSPPAVANAAQQSTSRRTSEVDQAQKYMQAEKIFQLLSSSPDNFATRGPQAPNSNPASPQRSAPSSPGTGRLFQPVPQMPASFTARGSQAPASSNTLAGASRPAQPSPDQTKLFQPIAQTPTSPAPGLPTSNPNTASPTRPAQPSPSAPNNGVNPSNRTLSQSPTAARLPPGRSLEAASGAYAPQPTSPNPAGQPAAGPRVSDAAQPEPAAGPKLNDKLSGVMFGSIAAKCPVANPGLGFQSLYSGQQPECPFHRCLHEPRLPSDAPDELELVLADTKPFKTHQSTEGTEQLLQSIGGGDKLRQLCTRFYVFFMLDKVLCTFITNFGCHSLQDAPRLRSPQLTLRIPLPDGPAAHGSRLGDWMVQKMGGEGEPWTKSGRWNMREPSHYRAWNSTERPRALRGRKFKLDDCRIWMRLMFWAVRILKLHEHKPFFRWYVKFIGHFITIYEVTAGPYAAIESEWSASEQNLREYEANGRIMLDIVPKPHLFLSPEGSTSSQPQGKTVYSGFGGGATKTHRR